MNRFLLTGLLLPACEQSAERNEGFAQVGALVNEAVIRGRAPDGLVIVRESGCDREAQNLLRIPRTDVGLVPSIEQRLNTSRFPHPT